MLKCLTIKYHEISFDQEVPFKFKIFQIMYENFNVVKVIILPLLQGCQLENENKRSFSFL